MEERLDRDTILKQIERYEELLAAVAEKAERRSILTFLEKEHTKLEEQRRRAGAAGLER